MLVGSEQGISAKSTLGGPYERLRLRCQKDWRVPLSGVILAWDKNREDYCEVTQYCHRHTRSPPLDPNLPKLGERGWVKRLREEDLPVALMHSTDFRSFFPLLDDDSGYERVTDVLAGVTPTSYKSSRVSLCRGTQLA
jgi:hypothetical protein